MRFSYYLIKISDFQGSSGGAYYVFEISKGAHYLLLLAILIVVLES